MAYNPGVSYQGADLIYDALRRGAQQTNNFLAGFLMPNKATGTDDSGQPAKGPSFGDRLKAGAASSVEGFDQFKQQSDESNALEKLLKVMYPDQKSRIDTMSLGEKRGMLQAGQLQAAQQTAKQQQLARILTALASQQRADAETKKAQAAADAVAAKKTPFDPTAGTKTITMADGTTIQVPYMTTSSGSAKALDEFVPGNPKYPKFANSKNIPEKPTDVQPPKGFEWIWNGKTWVMARKAAEKSGLNLFGGEPTEDSGATGQGADAADPLGLFTK